MNLIPKVKYLEIHNGYLENKLLHITQTNLDSRLLTALKHLPVSAHGTPLEININTDSGESYELTISEDSIRIRAEGPAGAFYAIQTLRQIYKEQEVPCLFIEDKPDFSYRGFYQDVTRGKIPTVASVKKLIDTMAYYKLNSLQLYVEHVFEFEESKDLWNSTGYLTKAELQEIGQYCQENFIEFVPSLSTFGHMYELLAQEKYRHLRVLKEFPTPHNFWLARMAHHTIDPLQPESILFVKSLINQYAPCFESDTFNICCDETFDLRKYEETGLDVGEIYLEFTKKIITHVQGLGKNIMMWGDVLLEHPEIITEFPEDVIFLNWYYSDNIAEIEDKIAKFAELGRKQIVCPGTNAWNRFCERVETEEVNITKMIEIGHKYGAAGVLNTNWGDWGNPESLELCMYGLVLGAEKSWSVGTELNEEFYSAVNELLYGSDVGIETLKKISKLNDDSISWWDFVCNYFEHRFGTGEQLKLPTRSQVEAVQKDYLEIVETLSKSNWDAEEYRQEMLLAAEGICVMAEMSGIMAGYGICRVTNTKEWLERFKEKWLEKNKESELQKIEDLFLYYDANLLPFPPHCSKIK